MQNSVKNLFGFPVKKWDDDFLYYEFPTTQKEQKFLQLVAKKRVECPACRKNIQLNRDPKKQNVDFEYLLNMLDDSFMSRRNTIVVPAGKMGFAMEIILSPIIERVLNERNS